MNPTKKQSILPLLTFAFALVMNAHAQSFLTNGLVAYYPLNGNATDASGNGNNGVIHGALTATDRFGISNGCFSFDGTNQYISALADKLPVTNRTISVWFKANRVDNRPAILGYGGNPCGTSFALGLNVVGYESYWLSTHCSAYTLSIPYTNPPVNAWHHWVVVMDEIGTQFYLDGQFIGSRDGVTETHVAGTELGLGTIPNQVGQTPYADPFVGYLDGFLDDVRFYNRALSTNEVQQLCEFESVPSCPAASIRVSGSEIEVCWPSRSNQLYQVDYRSDLTTAMWLPLFTNVAGSGQTICVADRIVYPQRFYRIVCPTNQP